MTKSLYFRVIMIFLGAVVLSLILSFFIIGQIFTTRMNALIQDEMLSGGKAVIRAYEQVRPDNDEVLMKELLDLPLYYLQIYDESGKLLIESLKPGQTHAGQSQSNDQIRQVLNGHIYQSPRLGKPDEMVVGLPFVNGDASYALFISPKFDKYANYFLNYLAIEFLLVLFIVSLFMMFATQYIVRPIRHLTSAARKIANGDFRIVLNHGRKDEIGQLTASFAKMAGQLEMLEQNRRQFVSNVSHEIQSPLTSIKGFTKALKYKKMDETRRQHLLTIIEEENERLSRLCEDLLQLSYLQYEQTELQLQRFQLDEQIRKVVIACEPQWSAKQIEIDLILPDLTLVADENKLAQVWINLLGNAVKFTDTNGKIRIELRQMDQQIEVAIEDNGFGIPEEECSHIFDAFYKVDQSRTSQKGGNGIGLSIVKRIIDLHHGDIVLSSKPGEGTTFTISLPFDCS